MRLADKVAVVTGAGQGIGRGIALAFAHEGARVVVNDIEGEAAEEVVQDIRDRGGTAVSSVESVATMEGAQRIIRCAIDHFGRIDILVNNAAILRPAPLLQMTERDWDETIAVNLKGVFACSQAAARHMVQQKSGRIINVTSAAGRKGVANTSPYAAAKDGVVGLTKVWARELGPYNITVNAISPSCLTRMVVGYDTAMDETFYEAYNSQKALKRTATPEEAEREIGPSYVFLASDEAGYITGEVIRVDGGAI